MTEPLTDEEFAIWMRRGDEVDLERIARAERAARIDAEAEIGRLRSRVEAMSEQAEADEINLDAARARAEAAEARADKAAGERDALRSGLLAIVNCQSPLTRAQMRDAAACVLEAAGMAVTGMADQSPFALVAATAIAERDVARAEGLRAGWTACRRSIYAVCEDVEREADEASKHEGEHAKGYAAGMARAAKSIARGFNAMEADDDDNLRAALSPPVPEVK